MATRAALPVGRTVADVALFLLAMTVAAVPLWSIYESWSIVVLVGVTLVVGAVVAILGALYRWSSAVIVPVTVGVFLLLGVPLAVPTRAALGVFPSADGMWQLLSGAGLGWKQLLTITLPVGSYQSLLVPAFVLVLVLTVAGLTTALRARHGERAVLAPIILFVAGIALGPESATWSVELTILLGTIILSWLMVRRASRRRAAIRSLEEASPNRSIGSSAREIRFLSARTVLSAVLIMAVAAIVGVAATEAQPPTGSREVLRTTIVQPFNPRDYVSPLAGFRRYLQEGNADAVMLTVAGLPAGAHIRVATLDDYDGVVYTVGSAQSPSVSGSFTRVPYRFDQSTVDGTQASIDVTIGAYTGVWLPTVGQFASIDFDGSRAATLNDEFYYNDNAGTAAVISGLREGDRYRLTAVIPAQPSTAAISALTPGSSELPPIGTVPAELAQVLDEYTRGVDGQGARLVAMLDGLRTNGYVSHGIADDEPPSRSGHSADRITQLFTDQRMIGDAEQYSVTAALMARALGFPARVVFGFAPHTTGSAATDVTGADVSAWIEVDTAQFGWVTIDPTPAMRDIPEEIPEDPSEVSRPQPIIDPPVEEPESRQDQARTDTSQDDPDELAPWLVIALAIARALGWILLAAGIVVSPFVVIVAVKARRRRSRRRAATAVARISGAWREYEDGVIDHGLQPQPGATRSEVAAVVGGSQPRVFAAVADRAVFSPDNPSEADVERVWRAVHELGAALDGGKSRWQRLKARISTRSLGGYSGKNLFKR